AAPGARWSPARGTLPRRPARSRSAGAPAISPHPRDEEDARVRAIWIGMLTVAAATAASAAMSDGKLVRVNGVTLWYETRGQGSSLPLMVLNGGPGVSHEYMLGTSVWQELARRRRVIFYDQRGTGRSPALAKGQSCTLGDQIADLEALRANLGIASMDVLGH